MASPAVPNNPPQQMQEISEKDAIIEFRNTDNSLGRKVMYELEANSTPFLGRGRFEIAIPNNY